MAARRQISSGTAIIDEITDAEQLGRVLSNKQQALLNTLPREVKKKFGHLGLLEGFESITTAEMWNRYYDEMDRVRQMKNMTLLNIHTVMRRFLEYFDPKGNPNRIRDNDALLWFNELRSKYAEATVTAYIQRSKAIFNWAVKNHYCDKNLFRGFILPTLCFSAPFPGCLRKPGGVLAARRQNSSGTGIKKALTSTRVGNFLSRSAGMKNFWKPHRARHGGR